MPRRAAAPSVFTSSRVPLPPPSLGYGEAGPALIRYRDERLAEIAAEAGVRPHGLSILVSPEALTAMLEAAFAAGRAVGQL